MHNVRMYVCTYVHTCVCMYVYMYVCVSVYMHVIHVTCVTYGMRAKYVMYVMYVMYARTHVCKYESIFD